MRKEITIGMLAIFLFAGLVSAIPPFPLMVSGRVLGNPGFTVRVTNLDTDMIWETTTNSYGEYSVDIVSSLTIGDDVEVRVVECDDSECVKVIRYQGGYEEFELNFDASAECPPFPGCPTCETCEPTECPEDTPYAECDSCCESDCPEPEPIDDNRAIEYLLAALAGATVTGSAVTLTLGKKAQHYHRGIKNKHSILTRHRNARIRHPIGEVAPVYVKQEDGKYHYVSKEKQ